MKKIHIRNFLKRLKKTAARKLAIISTATLLLLGITVFLVSPVSPLRASITNGVPAEENTSLEGGGDRTGEIAEKAVPKPNSQTDAEGESSDTSAPSSGYAGSVDSENQFRFSPATITLGGYNNIRAVVTVTAPNNQSFSPLSLSTKDNGEINLQTASMDADPGSQAEPWAKSRTISIQKTCRDCSGSTTIRVTSPYSDFVGYLAVNWLPSASYGDRGTTVSYIDNTDTDSRATFRFTFNITPKAYFGFPTIRLQMSHYNICINESGLIKSFKYTGDNDNSFAIDCVIDKSKPESKYAGSELYASLEITRSNGEAILGNVSGYKYLIPSNYTH